MGLDGVRSSARSLAVLGIVATTALWGMSYPMLKDLMETLPPATLGVLRLAIALAVLLPLLLARGGRLQFGWPAVLLGATGVAAFQLFQNVGMTMMPAGTAVIVLFGSSIVFTALLGWIALGERPNLAILVAMAGSAAGVVLVTIGGDGGTGMDVPVLGVLAILASALAWSAFAVVGRKTMAAGSAMEVNVTALVVGLVAMAPFAVLERPSRSALALDGRNLLMLVLLGAVVTAGSYALWAYGIQRLQANEASVLCSIEPAFGLFFAWMLLREGVSVAEAIGAVVIVTSCVLVARGEAAPASEPALEPQVAAAAA